MKKVSTIRKILAIALGAIVFTIIVTGLDYLFSDGLNWQRKGIINLFGGLAVMGSVALLLPRIVPPKEEKK
ncbi:MAG: hypothetical protein LBU22_01345 [Dysgonamonadaceae bacterium]|jgi:hypothetical protein|nr:hypothetical protein [Dysgonamonadaceae bacterium]